MDENAESAPVETITNRQRRILHNDLTLDKIEEYAQRIEGLVNSFRARNEAELKDLEALKAEAKLTNRCNCELRRRRWNPNTGKCETCWNSYQKEHAPRPESKKKPPRRESERLASAIRIIRTLWKRKNKRLQELQERNSTWLLVKGAYSEGRAERFSGADAEWIARERYKKASRSQNCILFKSVESNETPNAQE